MKHHTTDNEFIASTAEASGEVIALEPRKPIAPAPVRSAASPLILEACEAAGMDDPQS